MLSLQFLVIFRKNENASNLFMYFFSYFMLLLTYTNLKKKYNILTTGIFRSSVVLDVCGLPISI